MVRNNYTQAEIEKTWDETWKVTSSEPEAVFSNKLFKHGYAAFLPHLNLSSGSSFLEIGAGTGRYGFALAKEFPESNFVLTDPTESSIRFMQSLNSKLNCDNVKIELTDATKLQYGNDTFDVVLADAVIQHIKDYPVALAEMYRVLKPGGVLVVSAVNPINPGHALYKLFLRLRGKEYEYGYERCFSGRELKLEFKKLGLKGLKTDGFFVAYGILRHKHKSKWLARLGVGLGLLTKFIDKFTGRWLSRHFGFEVFAVGRK